MFHKIEWSNNCRSIAFWKMTTQGLGRFKNMNILWGRNHFNGISVRTYVVYKTRKVWRSRHSVIDAEVKCSSPGMCQSVLGKSCHLSISVGQVLCVKEHGRHCGIHTWLALRCFYASHSVLSWILVRWTEKIVISHLTDEEMEPVIPFQILLHTWSNCSFC